MAKFECNWCGKCCQSFGEFIKIERQVTERDYYCRYGITNELFQVHVLPEFADEIDEEFIDMDEKGKKNPQKTCIFMRKNPEGKGFACAIYPTRPTICKEFLCYRMLIQHPPTGEIRGKIIGINELRTHDEVLAAIWKEKIAQLPHPFESQLATVQHSHSLGGQASYGHDTHLLSHIHGTQHTEDHEWVANVITILAAHGYLGDPVVE
ncbi:MAG: YkgJ family cysteine cluster protein [Methanoregula sp.]|nr:YkgJ family cysteine cluster protein [Methanoregula sp.]